MFMKLFSIITVAILTTFSLKLYGACGSHVLPFCSLEPEPEHIRNSKHIEKIENLARSRSKDDPIVIILVEDKKNLERCMNLAYKFKTQKYFLQIKNNKNVYYSIGKLRRNKHERVQLPNYDYIKADILITDLTLEKVISKKGRTGKLIYLSPKENTHRVADIDFDQKTYRNTHIHL